jgi:Ricin-type beta-trefoil lectin domain
VVHHNHDVANVAINLGVVRFELTKADFDALQHRFSRSVLRHGPCMIIDRQTGLALDATPDATEGTNPVLWTPHAGPWQQWRFQTSGRGLVRIVSEPTKLVLTAMEQPHDWSPVWLAKQSEKAQQWRLKRTEDGVAFAIEHARSIHSLDTGQDAKNLDQPHLWSTHWAPWQQWMICRLPLV